MRGSFPLLFAILLTLLFPSPPGSAQSHGPAAAKSVLVLTHVSVIDLSAPDPQRAVHAKQTVIIDGSRIRAVDQSCGSRRAHASLMQKASF